MKAIEAGWIVTVTAIEWPLFVLRINPNRDAAVLSSRDGKRRMVRDVPLRSIQIIPDQMQAWAHDLSDHAADAIWEDLQPTEE